MVRKFKYRVLTAVPVQRRLGSVLPLYEGMAVPDDKRPADVTAREQHEARTHQHRNTQHSGSLQQCTTFLNNKRNIINVLHILK